MAPVEADRAGVCPGSARKADAAVENGMLSPGFRKAAVMAGWDEEALLAGLVVEDTPDRDPKKRKQFSRTPPTSSKRRRRSQRRSPRSVPVIALSLDEDHENTKGESSVAEEKSAGGSESADATAQKLLKTEEATTERVDDGQNGPATASALPCMDKLREELSCAICLDICFEPSTTACGHSFCLKCLKCATSKCGKRCPKCRDLIGNSRSCTVNTVLWNTIQLLFPEEVESRRKKKPTSPKQPMPSSAKEKPLTTRRMPNRSAFILSSELVSESELARSRRAASAGNGRRRVSVSQSEDAALALRLQREEFIGSVAERREQQVDVLPQRSPPSVHFARANLRALASRAIQLRTRVRF